MQSFRGRTARIGTIGDEIQDRSQALGITTFKSRALVDNNAPVIIWAKPEVDVGRSCWRSLVFETDSLNTR